MKLSIVLILATFTFVTIALYVQCNIGDAVACQAYLGNNWEVLQLPNGQIVAEFKN